MEELLKEYEETMTKLFDYDDWLKKTNTIHWRGEVSCWEDFIVRVRKGHIVIKGKNAEDIYNTRLKLIKKAEQLQRDLKAHRKCGV